jgi:hypothetical protein
MRKNNIVKTAHAKRIGAFIMMSFMISVLIFCCMLSKSSAETCYGDTDYQEHGNLAKPGANHIAIACMPTTNSPCTVMEASVCRSDIQWTPEPPEQGTVCATSEYETWARCVRNMIFAQVTYFVGVPTCDYNYQNGNCITACVDWQSERSSPSGPRLEFAWNEDYLALCDSE